MFKFVMFPKEQLLNVVFGVDFLITVVLEVVVTIFFSFGMSDSSHCVAAITKSSSFTSSIVSASSSIMSN